MTHTLALTRQLRAALTNREFSSQRPTVVPMTESVAALIPAHYLLGHHPRRVPRRPGPTP
ncbi:hypothetical protein ACRJ4W_12850 [Streptomyces sp. GLT-R25]